MYQIFIDISISAFINMRKISESAAWWQNPTDSPRESESNTHWNGLSPKNIYITEKEKALQPTWFWKKRRRKNKKQLKNSLSPNMGDESCALPRILLKFSKMIVLGICFRAWKLNRTRLFLQDLWFCQHLPRDCYLLKTMKYRGSTSPLVVLPLFLRSGRPRCVWFQWYSF